MLSGQLLTPETRVLMADGTTRDIDDFDIGDLVLAADPTTGQTSAEPVTDLIIGSGEKDLVTITADPDGDGRAGSVVATTGHPFHTTTGWRDAGNLTRTDRLTTDTGTTYAIGSTVKQPRQHATVYNLTVANLHTYYVVIDDAPALVHNCGFNSNQRALISLAKRHHRGVSRQDARVLDQWRREYGLSGHGIRTHPNRSGIWGHTPHIKIHNIHVRVM